MSDIPPPAPPTPPAPPAPPAPPPPAPPTPPAPPAAGTLTQDEVNAIAAREKAEGKRQAERELADKLGVTPDEAAAIIKAHKDAETAALTEAQKAAKKAGDDAAAAAADRAAAAADRRTAAIERALTAEGCGAFEADEAKRQQVIAAATAMVRIPDDTKPDDLAAAVAAEVAKLKGTMAPLFAATATPPGTPPHPGTPPGVAPPPPSSAPTNTPPAPRPPAGGLAAGFERGRAAAGTTRRSWVDPANAPAAAPGQPAPSR